jgi:hypothetical protein
LLLGGCADRPDLGSAVKAQLEKLSTEDRDLAVKQKYCVVQEKTRLGSMGVPVKLMIKDEPVFLCCKACSSRAQKNPDKTLAKLKELRTRPAPP